MKDYYLDGEEKFGAVSSFGYWLNTRVWMGAFYRFVVEDVAKTGFEDLLDVGTGAGDIPIMLSRIRKAGGRIYAVDPSPYMLKIARFRAKGNGIAFAQGSSRSIPFKTRFDMIISTLSFHHWAGREQSLRYLSSLLKKGGEIRIYEYERKGLAKVFAPSHSVSKDELEEASASSGLKLKRIMQKGGFIMAAFSK